MKNARLRRALRFSSRAVLLSLLAFTLSAVCAFPFAARFLVAEDPIQPADAIVVLAGSRAARWMEALDLYKEKLAPHVVLSSGRMEKAELQLLERGVRLPRQSDLARAAMIQLGVPPEAVEVFRDAVDNTAQEATVTRALAEERGWTQLLIVTSTYHTRRTRYAFDRSFRGSGIRIGVRGTRYDDISPKTWWAHRFDVRWVLIELPKLIAYRFGLEG